LPPTGRERRDGSEAGRESFYYSEIVVYMKWTFIMESSRISVAETASTASTTTLVTEDIPLIPKHTDDFCSRLESKENM
jgi:hypothetical protein